MSTHRGEKESVGSGSHRVSPSALPLRLLPSLWHEQLFVLLTFCSHHPISRTGCLVKYPATPLHCLSDAQTWAGCFSLSPHLHPCP